MVGHLSLEAVDVAGVAEQVALQRVAAVALLVVQHQAAVLQQTHRDTSHMTVNNPEDPTGPSHLYDWPLRNFEPLQQLLVSFSSCSILSASF